MTKKAEDIIDWIEFGIIGEVWPPDICDGLRALIASWRARGEALTDIARWPGTSGDVARAALGGTSEKQ